MVLEEDSAGERISASKSATWFGAVEGERGGIPTKKKELASGGFGGNDSWSNPISVRAAGANCG